MLTISHLTKYYTRSKPIISDMNLKFGSAGLNIIVGKSGCGKTTLLNMIGTMDQDYIGSIELDGVELSRLSIDKIADYRNYESAYIFQQNSLFEHMTVRENIELVLNLQSKKVNIEEVLDTVGLSRFANKKVKYLSGGERQRVGIARAIAKDSKVILADEPTSALDSKNAHKILSLFKEISKEKLVIVVTHDTKKAFQYADRIIKLVDGRVVEDDIINDVQAEPIKIKKKAPKSKLLLPIFLYQLRKSLLINLFVVLLCSLAIVATNIQKEQSKILKEYNDFKETGSYVFNDLKALTIHEANQIDFYNVVRANEDDTIYKYFETVSKRNEGLTDQEISTVNKIFKDANIHYGDSNYGNVIIEDLSVSLRFNQSIGGIQYYWRENQRTDYGYYVYNENNDYNLIYGTKPTNENEMLITDVVADHFLNKNGFGEYSMSSLIGTEFVVGDIYYISPNPAESNYLYHHTTPKTYTVSGIIGTNQLDFYDYEITTNKYQFINGLGQKTKNDDYLNHTVTTPYAYIVVPNYLDAYKTYKFYEEDINVLNAMYTTNNTTNKKLRTFHGLYDYRGFIGYDDDLGTDKNGRLLIKDSGITKLTGNKVIASQELIRKIFPSYTTETLIKNNYSSEISGKQFTMTFETEKGSVDYTFTIAGVSKVHSNEPLMFISEEFYDLYKSENFIYDNNSVTVELSGLNARERIKLIQEAYKKGFVLVPQYSVPGPYMEFVETQGEIVLVDDEGYEEETNISVYYLFSDFYNTEQMNGINYTLEILSSVYMFILFMAISLSLGLIYLKERRQKMNIMKLSQIGVYTKSMIRMNFISYIIVALAIGTASYFLTDLLINIINSIFTVKIDIARIYRFRVIMTNTTLISAIVGLVIALIIGLLSSIIVVKKSRR